MNQLLTCKVPSCGHEWYTRLDRPPKTCPRCKSYKWREGLSVRTNPASLAVKKAKQSEARAKTVRANQLKVAKAERRRQRNEQKFLGRYD